MYAIGTKIESVILLCVRANARTSVSQREPSSRRVLLVEVCKAPTARPHEATGPVFWLHIV